MSSSQPPGGNADHPAASAGSGPPVSSPAPAELMAPQAADASPDGRVSHAQPAGDANAPPPPPAQGADVMARPAGMHVVFRDLTFTLRVNEGRQHLTKTILSGVHGAFRSGEMTAVMGPSGSGKSTLLDLLSGRKTLGLAVGTVRYGSKPPSRSLLRRFCGYCEQQDTLIDTLTVEEMLMYTALLKRPPEEPRAYKQDEVEKLLKQLALQGCRATRIGTTLKRGISGGQAKRVNIAIALITEPAVLFLDEPTSGLDSFTANEVMTIVKGIAATGVTIASTIHSPTSYCYALFDSVMVLVAGHVAFAGRTQEQCTSYCTGVLGVRPLNTGENLAEYLMDYLTLADIEGRGDALAEAYSTSDLALHNYAELDNLEHEATAWEAGKKKSVGRSASSFKRLRSMPGSLRQILLPGATPSAGSGGARGSELVCCGFFGTTPGAAAAAAAHHHAGVVLDPDTPGGVGAAAAAAAHHHAGVVLDPDTPGGVANGALPAAPHTSGHAHAVPQRLDLTFASSSGGCCGLLDSSWAYVTPWYASLGVLLRYRTANNYRTMDYLGPRMFDKVIFAIVIMLLYLQKGDDFSDDNTPNLAALMYLCIAQPAWGAVGFIPAIIAERALYVRERSDGLYRPISYILFKMIDELSLNWVVGLASAGIMFGGVGMQGSYVYFWLMLMATLSNGVAIAYSISALCSTMDLANAIVPTILAIKLFLSGFLIRVPDIPVYLRWITYINMLKYSWGGLMINQFEAHPEATIGGNRVLEYYELDNALGKWGNLGVVLGFFAFWMALAWWALAFVKHQKR